MTQNTWRKTSQSLMPSLRPPAPEGQYDLYPAFPLGNGKIALGFVELAIALAEHRTVVLDGYVGVYWEHFQSRLDAAFRQLGVRASWVTISGALLPPEQVDDLVAPFLGGEDPLFGTRCTQSLVDFFDQAQIAACSPDPEADVSILYGCGAALAGWEGFLVYVDVPKNEIQFRSRAGSITNLGAAGPEDPKVMYKRFYFVDWVVLNKHKAALVPLIDMLVDEQRPDDPAIVSGDDLRGALHTMSRNYFRVRPWFEPGAWGGNWIMQHIPQLPQDVPNYAWSFELIVPENGLLFESDGRLVEASFDFLMYHDYRAVLGDSAEVFGWEFPIRFDLLDTWDGGNLSIQCHPRPEYVRHHFGERITQDETYYFLDCKPGAQVYLGFQDDIDPKAFQHDLERSFAEATPLNVRGHLNVEPVQKHDLILIPNGTVHCSGEGALVLEISATPYIFTFKMYDWMRLDLDGRPRPLNIDRALENLYFDRKGPRMRKEFISQPNVIAQGDDWQLLHLPTHPEHFYDVHRYEFATSIETETAGTCHILSLVEGDSVILETDGGYSQRFNFAETFVVPAAARRYRLTNQGPQIAKVVKAFIKKQHNWGAD